MKEGSPRTTYLKDYSLPPFLIDSVDLTFVLGDEETRVTSVLNLRRNPECGSDTEPLILDGEELELVNLVLNGEKLTPKHYLVDNRSLTILSIPAQCRLEIETRIRPQDNTSLEGLYKSSGNFCTQCEAQGFRKITYFLDRPDVMAVYTTTLQANRQDYPVLLSNGNLVDSGELPEDRHYATWQDPYRKPSYLFALVAGKLSCQSGTHTTASGREIDLRLYVQEHNIDKCDHAMASLKKAMLWDEQTFGLEYDLDIYMIVAVDDFNMGAMENKGLNVFNSKCVLARPETATDSDYTNIEAVIAHEYFHNWTGNRVTCRDWFQLSLKEGLTVYRDQRFTADMTSPSVKRIQDVRMLRAVQFAEDAGPMAHPVRPQSYIEINNFYTVTVYEKGAEVVRLYETLLGRDGFRKGMDLYFQRHDGQAVTTDDFAAAMADANGRDLTVFKRWYDQAGTPKVSITSEWDADEGQYSLRIIQSCPATPLQPDKKPFHVPLKLGLLDASGRDMPLQLLGENEPEGSSRVLEVTKAEQSFTFINMTERPIPSLLRGFSAPVKLQYDYSDAELAFLLAHDIDSFNRWEAGYRLALITLNRLIADYQSGRELEVNPAFVTALEQTLNAENLDRALIAETLSLPSESDLAEHMSRIDVDAIHAAREFLRKNIARSLESQLVKTYEATTIGGEYQYQPGHAGNRRLRNSCLAYLTTLGNTEYLDLALEQFQQANNMTDTMGALQALIDTDSEQRRIALGQFEHKWQHDTLVMDKWFSLQASCSHPDTLAGIQALMQHPLFSIRNPNKVRALIGAFAAGNPVNFHNASGEGYRFVADRVIQLDSLNPQVAARLVKTFSRWKKFTGVRKDMMQAQLKRIAQTENLSSDVYEIVSKSL